MRLRILLFLVFCWVCTGGGLLAQEPPVFCGDLAPADCALLTESGQVMAGLQSSAFHLDMTIALGGEGGAFPNSFNLRLVGDGAYTIDPQAVEAASALLENPSDLPQTMENLLRGISAQMSLRLELPRELMAMISPGGVRTPDSLEFEVRLIEGIGYINLDKFTALRREFAPGWYGLDVAGLYRVLLEQQIGAAGQMPFFNFGFNMAPSFEGVTYMSILRGPDAQINGQTAAVFSTTFDFETFLTDPETGEMFKNLMRDALRQQGMGAMGFDIDEFMEAYAELLSTMNLTTSQVVGLDDHYVHRMSMNLAWNPDLTALMRSMGVPDSSASAEMAFNFMMNLALELSQFNNVPPLAAPDGANIIPLNVLLPFLLPGNLGQA